MHRCTGAHSDALTRKRERQREREGEGGADRREEERARQDGERRGSVGGGSVVLVSLSLTLGARDKPLLMEEINFGLNRSPATL
jgi:hypothetical protein